MLSYTNYLPRSSFNANPLPFSISFLYPGHLLSYTRDSSCSVQCNSFLFFFYYFCFITVRGLIDSRLIPPFLSLCVPYSRTELARLGIYPRGSTNREPFASTGNRNEKPSRRERTVSLAPLYRRQKKKGNALKRIAGEGSTWEPEKRRFVASLGKRSVYVYTPSEDTRRRSIVNSTRNDVSTMPLRFSRFVSSYT